MTLRTWLSSNNVSHQKHKMTVGVSVAPSGNIHESPTRGCAIPTVCGGLKLRHGRNWKTKSVEDGLEGAAEQGDYGFLEYFSMRRSNSKDIHIDSEKTYDSWNQFQSSWSQRSDWSNYTHAQFYPGTLNRQETTSRKRSRKDRPQSLHHEVQLQRQHSLFSTDDLCTSTPLSSPHRDTHSFRHNYSREILLEKPKTSTGLLKRNSVLSKFRPDRRNKGLDGTLRRCRSKDDVLSSSHTTNMAMSQPDLLISHNTSRIDEMCSLNNLSAPAPLSILPPTCRNAAANVSQTLPRRRRASDTNKENTLLARGKKWLTGVTNKENDGPKHHSFSCHHRIEDFHLDLKETTLKPVSENIFLERSKKLVPENDFKEKTVGNLYLAQEKHPLERLRCRRPLTFYLLEDYLSPVKGSGRDVELDEFLGRTQRVLFNECPQRPLPPTPEWDTPSLSPPPSLTSGLSHHYDQGGCSLPVSISNEGSFNLINSYLHSPDKSSEKPPSPVFTLKESEIYPKFLTPENSLTTEPKSLWHNHLSKSPITTSPPSYSHHQYLNVTPEKRTYISEGSKSTITQQVDNFSPYSRVHSNSISYPTSSSSYSHSHSHSHIGSVNNLHSMDYSSSSQFVRPLPQNKPGHNCPERRPSNARDRRKVKSTDVIKKSPGQQKEALQRLGRSGTSVNKNQVSGKSRQNGLVVTSQKLPSLSNNNNSNSSRMNLPLENSRLGLSDGESMVHQGHSSSRLSSGPLPVLNNNKGEIFSEYSSPKVTNNKNLEDPSYGKEKRSIKLHHSPQDAVRLYGDRLTTYEKREIESYPEIWYLGLDARKIHGEEGAQLNGGYDDENGSYNKVMHDHISYRYEILEVIGKGSFGQVIRAIDHKNGDQVAIKIIRNKKRFHHQALVEVKILDHLRKKDCDNHHNVIHMLDYFYFRNHLCITFELMGLNLYELIKKNSYQGFGLSIIKRFAFSLVQCLKLLAKENIIHCDLKPENVLLKERGGTSIRVIDFGSSCYTHQRVYTYIQSRFYRSPEVILGLPYGLPIDMWSLGCILTELYTGYPLFPGENEVEQLACIMEAMGLPPQHLLINASRRRLFFDSKGSPRCVTNSKGKKRRPGSRELSSVLKSPDSNFVNFITRCLEWDPSQRLTPDDALQHEWLQSSSSISTTPTSYSSSSIERKSNGGSVTRRPGPLNGSELSETDGAVNSYRVYKCKKRDTSTTRVSVGASRSTDGGGVTPTDAVVTVNNNNNGKEAESIDKEEISQPAPTVNNAESENSLDDSGTFLPPIL